MDRGETRTEKAIRRVSGKHSGVEYHVYRMGHLTDYCIGTVYCDRGVWSATNDSTDQPGYRTRKAAIAALCSDDDRH